MASRYWIVLLASGCADLAGIGDPAPLAADAPEVPCVIGGLDLCLFSRPQAPLVIDTDFTIDTSRDCTLVVYAPPAPSVCVLYAHSVEINAKLTATGSRPLVIAASDTIVVNATVDVSSYRMGNRGAAANDSACTYTSVNGQYGGSSGGSFAGKGGDGGDGYNGDKGDIAGPAVTRPAALRGGCSGGSISSAGGGAVWLAAGTSIELSSTGRVLANGAGGGVGFSTGASGGGSAGGGSGGFIRLSAPTLQIAGVLAANGGGGSEGSDAGATGKLGSDGIAGSAAAAGGSGGSVLGGDGGAGGAGGSPNGGGGLGAATGSSAATGGGGGGAVGFIHLVGDAIQTPGTLSPPPST